MALARTGRVALMNVWVQARCKHVTCTHVANSVAARHHATQAARAARAARARSKCAQHASMHLQVLIARGVGGIVV